MGLSFRIIKIGIQKCNADLNMTKSNLNRSAKKKKCLGKKLGRHLPNSSHVLL